jgi:hypothetical protein
MLQISTAKGTPTFPSGASSSAALTAHLQLSGRYIHSLLWVQLQLGLSHVVGV